jgi:hypothetical protein
LFYLLKDTMSKNKGDYLERIVEMLERSLTLDAVVERNVHLPIIGSPSGGTAQCDVVIRSGPPHRQTLTIVEVQDRKRPVEIGHFRNWVLKREQVGAQHLYCVSRLPFSKTIKEQAVQSGHTIKLITLEKLDDGKIPLDFFNLTQIYNDADIISVRKIEVIFPALEAHPDNERLASILADLKNLRTNDFKFSFDQRELLAISTICLRSVPTEQDVIERKDILEIGYDSDRPAFYYFNNELIQIKLKIEFTWSLKKVEMAAAIWSYTQDDHGELAWLIETHYYSSRGLINTNIPVVKDGDNFMLPGFHIALSEPLDIGLQLIKVAGNP